MAFTLRLVKGSALTWAEFDNNLSEIEAKWLEILAISGNALAAANFVGQWNALTGSLDIPAASYWSGKFWLLLADVVDVTAHEPGVSASWAELVVGNVLGPVSATAGNIAVLDATGKVISDGGVAPAALMPKTGGVFTGGVTTPSINGGQLAGLRNKVINGKMVVAQRGTSFSSFNTYLLDRWIIGAVTSAVASITQSTDVPNEEFQYSLRTTISTVDTSLAAGDTVVYQHAIEGHDARDLIGRPFTVSFWVRSSKIGVHCFAIRNSGADRSYATEYTINAANTWEKKSITISPGLITAGTWDWTTGSGLRLNWALAAGTNFQTTPGAWQTGNYTATAAQVNCLDTIGNIFAITGVQLEVSPVATPFEHRPYAVELALCQRYYYRRQAAAANDILADTGHHITTTTARVITPFPVPMRAVPTVLEQSGVAGDYRTISSAVTAVGCSAVPTFVIASRYNAMSLFTVASGLTVDRWAYGASANGNAYLGWSADL